MNTSKPVSSSQRGPHPGLARRVLRQARADWRKPPQTVDSAGLAQIDAALAAHRGPIVLDSFCGTGVSTIQLARAHCDALLIGIDQSAHRLGRADELPPNALLLRAHCEAVWRHLVHAGVRLDAHYILYPNPWPKAAHLGRRIHGHPALSLLPRLGGSLELRSNWQTYVEEFGMALGLLGHPGRVALHKPGAVPETRFERKYAASGHRLWRFTVQFPARVLQAENGADKSVYTHELYPRFGYPAAKKGGQ
ncbi:MAG: SAM-dependent methyltransferase [Halieaceae bacterium]|jgi:tRNA G46 methylase TrmB|nr:SAM-dependent methyltransferase [Halieaceae bacterium]